MSRAALRRAALLLAALPLALVGVVLVEVAWIPVRQWIDRPVMLAGIAAWLAHHALWLLAAPVLFQVAASLMALLAGAGAESGPATRGRFLACSVSALLAAAAVGTAYATLIRHWQMLNYPIFAVLHVAFFAWLAISLVIVLVRTSRGLLRLVAATGIGGAAVLHVINRSFFSDAYPTLHLCALQLTMLAFMIGVAAVLAIPRTTAWRWPLPAAAVAGVLLLAGAAAARAGAFRAARTPLVTHALLGQAEVIFHPPGQWLPSWLKDTPQAPHARDPDGLARFAAQSGFPTLPESFDLSRHSVLLVTLEATRWDQTSLARPDLDTTPRLKRLATEGSWWWTEARSPGSRTLESMSSIHAMVPASAVRIEAGDVTWFGIVADENLMAAEIFAACGHRTFWVSHDLLQSLSVRMPGMGQGFQHRTLFTVTERGQMAGVDRKVADAAMAQVRAARGQPFFGWVFFSAGHADVLSNDYAVRFEDRPANTKLERYRQGLAAADAQLGRLLDGLAAEGLDDEVVVIVAGDHGEAFGEHRTFLHGVTLHEEVVHVPLVVRVPGAEGGRLTRPASLTHVLPWLMLAGDERMRAVATTRVEWVLGPMLRATDGAVVMELLEPLRKSSALLHERKKLIVDLRVDVPLLFDLERDPRELDSLFGRDPALDEEHVSRFRRYWQVRRALQRQAAADARK